MCDLRDQPAPGRGYLYLLGALSFVPTVVVLAFTAVMAAGDDLQRTGDIAALAVVLVLTLLAPALLVHAAHRTVYEIDPDALRLRSGIVIWSTVQYPDISRIEPVGFIPRVLGWGGGWGIANRMSNGLLITLESGRKYYISPTDPDAFANALRKRMSQARTQARRA